VGCLSSVGWALSQLGRSVVSQIAPLCPNLKEVEQCDECGFEYDLDEALGAGSAVAKLVSILETDTESLRTRREPEIWSPLEYCCHVRDVLLCAA
jgi:hypothetical protein